MTAQRCLKDSRNGIIVMSVKLLHVAGGMILGSRGRQERDNHSNDSRAGTCSLSAHCMYAIAQVGHVVSAQARDMAPLSGYDIFAGVEETSFVWLTKSKEKDNPDLPTTIDIKKGIVEFATQLVGEMNQLKKMLSYSGETFSTVEHQDWTLTRPSAEAASIENDWRPVEENVNNEGERSERIDSVNCLVVTTSGRQAGGLGSARCEKAKSIKGV
ncbi:hypothetical protein GGR51DRAFT_554768 [Nemania sp. FL0031]|nr:hypothetical protein GGR51DRAFT_554768 [Nemania sp. FL0031]